MAHEFKVIISDEEYRAFQLIVADPDEWVEHAVRNKVRKCMIYVAERVAQNVGGLLSPSDRAEIEADMLAAGDVMKQPKHYSEAIKKKIAAKTTMKIRAVRDEEELVALEG